MSKKRANGEGSIRKRKDGRWEGRYTAGYDKGGKVITKNVLGKTQAEVKEKLKTAIEESQKLDPTRTGQYTVQTWVTLWYEVFKPKAALSHLLSSCSLFYTDFLVVSANLSFLI